MPTDPPFRRAGQVPRAKKGAGACCDHAPAQDPRRLIGAHAMSSVPSRRPTVKTTRPAAGPAAAARPTAAPTNTGGTCRITMVINGEPFSLRVMQVATRHTPHVIRLRDSQLRDFFVSVTHGHTSCSCPAALHRDTRCVHIGALEGSKLIAVQHRRLQMRSAKVSKEVQP